MANPLFAKKPLAQLLEEMHGFDQFLHHLTYSGMLFLILASGAEAT